MDTLVRMLCIVFLIGFSFTIQGQHYLEFLYENDLTFKEKVERAEAHFDEKGRGKHTGYKQFLRWKYIAQRSLDDNGFVMTEEQEIAAYENFKRTQPVDNRSSMTWQEKGPLSAVNTATWSSHIGRLSNIAIDPNDDQHFLVTSLGGGAWKSTDEGSTWAPLFDDENTMNLQSAMISHADSDVYFIGTSGIRRSTDGGLTWSSLSGVSGTIYTILMHPTDEDIILASSSNGRVYRSTNGGDSWSSVTIQSNARFYDLEFMPDDPDVVYAAGSRGAVYKSTDNGVTFTELTGPWNGSRSVMVATTADDSDYLYALQETSGGFNGLYLSTDAGLTWTTQSDNNSAGNIMGYSLGNSGGQAPRDMDVIVNPTNKDEVHVAGIMTFKSTNAGVDWTQTTHWVLSNPLPFVHADIDQLIYRGSKIYVASDGGLFISYDGGNSFVDKTTGLGIRQFYRISASTTEVGRVAGGSQDNGTGVMVNDIWYDYVGADGMEPCILNNDDDVVIASIQYGGLYKSADGGQTRVSISNTQGGDNGEWVTPLERDPIMSNVIYQGKRHLYKSTNAGASWQTISDVTPPSGNTNMDHITIASSNNQVIFISYSEFLYKTTDGGNNWSDVSPPAPYDDFINYISIDPYNEDHIILCISNSNRVIESNDGGNTWNSIRHNLPNTSSRSLVFDGTSDNGMYISLSKGVYYKDDNSPTTWTLMDTGLPKVDVRELEIVNDKLYAATYGRGLWELSVPGKGFTMNANPEIVDCLSQGTQDVMDDRFTFKIRVEGMNLTGQYSITGDITGTGLNYGDEYTFDNNGAGYAISDGPVEFTVTDDTNTSYTKDFSAYQDFTNTCFSNYYCVDAFLISGTGTYSAIGPTTGGGGSDPNRDANWFRFHPGVDGLMTIRSCGYGVDTRLKIHTGDCDDLTQIASNDDTCPMGPGQNSWASELEDIVVEADKVYFIEWDDRWSGNGFDFDFIFVEECFDYIIADVTDAQQITYSNGKQIHVKGTSSGKVTVDAEENGGASGLTLNSPGLLSVRQNDCELDNSVQVYGTLAVSKLIPDNSFSEYVFDFPTSFNQNVEELSLFINVQHEELSELRIEIELPSGEMIDVWNSECSGEGNLNFKFNTNAYFQDFCTESWIQGRPVYADGQLTNAQLNAISNSTLSGTWKVKISDSSSGNSGELLNCGLILKGL